MTQAKAAKTDPGLSQRPMPGVHNGLHELAAVQLQGQADALLHGVRPGGGRHHRHVAGAGGPVSIGGGDSALFRPLGPGRDSHPG